MSFTSLEQRLKEAKDVEDTEMILETLKRGLPYRDATTDQIQQRLHKLKLDVDTKRADAIRYREWQKFESDYHVLMREGNLSTAAQRLVEKANTFPQDQVDQLKLDFIKKCVLQLKTKTDSLAENKQWSRARETLQEIRTNRYVKELLPHQELRTIEDMEHEVNVKEDKYLYALIENPKTRTMEAIDTYLNNAPLKTMKNQVQSYRAYLKTMEGPLQLEIAADGLASQPTGFPEATQGVSSKRHLAAGLPASEPRWDPLAVAPATAYAISRFQTTRGKLWSGCWSPGPRVILAAFFANICWMRVITSPPWIT